MSMNEMHDPPPRIRPLGGRVAIERPNGEESLVTPATALEIAQRLLDAAAAAEGQKLLLRDIMTRPTPADRIVRH